ncbi:hypothetical protein RI367_000272 [Sorochytrium milnesiophthora]
MTASKDQIKPAIELAYRGADSFIKAYYDIYDNQPNQLHGFYKDNSAISWNGNAYNGAGFQSLVASLPSRTHQISSYDAQPILATSAADGRCSFIITVHGSVQYGKQQRYLFTQTVILTPDPERGDVHYISNDCYRFV